MPSTHSHSIINEARKPAWLKDLAVIDMGLYRRFYRQKRRSFAGAGDGAICGASTFSTPSSISSQDTGEIPDRQPPQARASEFHPVADTSSGSSRDAHLIARSPKSAASLRTLFAQRPAFVSKHEARVRAGSLTTTVRRRVERLAKPLAKSGYGQYLLRVAQEKIY